MSTIRLSNFPQKLFFELDKRLKTNYIAMIKIINFLSVFCFIAVIATSCEKEPILEVSQSSFTISNQGSSQTISFSTNKDWSASVSGGTWCTISPASGNSDVKSITVTIAANDTYDDRSATITIKAKELTKVITISQPKNKAIIIQKKSNNLSFYSQTLEVEFKTNIDYEIIIPESSKSWIYNSNTKALRTEKLLLNISENTSNKARSAEIYIKDKVTSLQDTLNFTQYEKNAYCVNEMGTLGTILNQIQKDTISIMIIKGEINKADFEVMKSQMPKLSHLDLKDVKCDKDEIPDEAFGSADSKANKIINTIVLPEKITRIGNLAFCMCSGLTGPLVFPNGLITIGDWAFLNCFGLTGSLILPAELTTIGESAFQNTKLTGTLTLSNSLTTIGEYAFASTKFTGSLQLPSGVTTIGGSAFSECKGFTGSLTLPSGLTNIGDRAFENCSGFTGPLTIPEKLKTIGLALFSGCSGFTGSLNLPSGLITIGGSAFSECKGFTGSLTLPSGLTTLGEGAFYNCSGFTGSLLLPSGLTTIGKSTFYNCSGFTGSLTLPNGLKRIDDNAFSYTNFTGSLTLPTAVEYIGKWAFFGCNDFTGSLNLPSGLTDIQEYTFGGCFGFTGSLVLPEGLKTIGKNAFQSTRFTGTLTLPDGLTTIEQGAFNSCRYLDRLIFGDHLVTIKESAFANCSYISGNVIFPMSLNSIKSGAFTGCNKVNAFRFPHSIPLPFSSYMIPTNATVQVPSSAVATYKATDGWKSYNIVGY